MSLKWERADGKLRLMLGRVKVAQVFNSPYVVRGDPPTWRAVCSLPRIKPVLGDYTSEASAMHIAERAVRHWFNMTGLPGQEVEGASEV